MRIVPSTRRLTGRLLGKDRTAECIVVVNDDGSASEVRYIETSPPPPDGDYTLIVRDEQRGRWRCQSGLSRTVKKDGVTVEVSIIRLEHEPQWSLEVVNSAGTSTVWDELFASDEDAYAEFERTVADEGMQAFLDEANVIPFRR
jgi:hypothetical protein